MFYQEPSSDESRDLATEIDITDLYKSIGAPNPIEKNNQYSSEVKTAYKLNFKYRKILKITHHNIKTTANMY